VHANSNAGAFPVLRDWTAQIYIHGNDGTCPKCPYEPGTILEAPVENLMQLVPRIIVGEDRFRETTGVDIRQPFYDPFHPRA